MQVSVQRMGTISSSFIFNSPRCYSRSISHRPLISNTFTLKRVQDGGLTSKLLLRLNRYGLFATKRRIVSSSYASE